LTQGRVVSIDYGLARIGLAVSDERKIIASSLGVLEREKGMEATLQKLLAKLSPYTVETIIVGLPLHLDGKKSFLSEETTFFMKKLQEAISCPVLPWDERLSTAQAERFLRETTLTRKKKAGIIDAIAAMILLQSYIDSL